MELGQLVKKIGKYLYKELPNTLQYNSGANECTISMSVFYVLYEDIPGEGENMTPQQLYSLLDIELSEMIVNINITTYSNKIRVNIIEKSPEEYTIGHIVYVEDQLYDWVGLRDKIIDDVYKKIDKSFTGEAHYFSGGWLTSNIKKTVDV